VRVGIIGGGPGGLYLAALLKASRPGDEVVVAERNGPDDTFGFGVVFSDSTMRSLAAADPVVHRRLREATVSWDDVEVRHRGERLSCGGNGFAAIGRRALLQILRRRCEDLGVELRFHAEASVQDLGDCHVVVAADGVSSRTRQALEPAFRPTMQASSLRFIWCGTAARFEALTFLFERDAAGAWFGVHAYPTGADTDLSTFIVEVDGNAPPASLGLIQSLFAQHLGGQAIVGNNSRWGTFRTLRCATWHHANVALVGDAAHTAHFSVGAGTRMAMEDALALSDALRANRSVDDALAVYEAARRPAVERIQAAARPSLGWWERFGRSATMAPTQFAFHFLTRSRRLGREGLAARDPAFAERVEAWFRGTYGVPAGASPLLAPLPALGLPNRVIAVGGAPGAGLTLHPRPQPVAGGRWGLLTASGEVAADAALNLLDGRTLDPGAVAATVRGMRDRAGGAPVGVLLAPTAEADAVAAAAVRAGAAVVGAAVPAREPDAELAATTLTEAVRLELGAISLLVAPGAGEDWAATALLSGRADLVAFQGPDGD
jgi:2-polyprenyl-6-methoxyphenol hydroxylase-like FAD-dependent oxidoreductase